MDDKIEDKKQFVWLLVGLYMLGTVYHLVVGRTTDQSAISQPFNMLFIYMLGRYFNKYEVRVSRMVFPIVEVLFMVIVVCMYVYVPSPMLWHVFTNGNPLVIICAVSLFYVFQSRTYYNIYINMFASSVFAIYLATDAFLGRWLYSRLYCMMQNNVLITVLGVLILGITIVLIESVRKYITPRMIDKNFSRWQK